MFTLKDWGKHDHKYVRSVITDLINDKAVRIIDRLKGSFRTIEQIEYDRKVLNYILDNLGKVDDDILQLEFDHAIKIPKKPRQKSIWTIFDKSPYSGVKGTTREDSGELSVCIFLDQLMSGKPPNIQNYQKSNQLIIDNINLLQTTKNYISTAPTWEESSLKIAERIVTNLNDVVTNHNPEFSLSSYSIHYKTKMVNTIRTRGSKLSQLAKDKWNPSDFYLIDNRVSFVPNNFQSIVEFNEWCCSNTVGISLKKDDHAILGAIALKTIESKILNNNFIEKKWMKKELSKLMNLIRESLSFIKNSSIGKYVFLSRGNKGSDREIILSLINQKTVSQEDVDKLNVANIGFNVGNGLKFFADVLRKNDSVENFVSCLEMIYYYAIGATEKSCSHYLATPTRFNQVYNGISKDFEFNSMIVPIGGTSSIYINVTIDGSKEMIEMRSKGRDNSDFNIKHGHGGESLTKIPLTEIKFLSNSD